MHRMLMPPVSAVLTASALSAFLAAPAFAQDAYPSRPITMVVPFPPGGVADLTGRPTRSEERRVGKECRL